jgi:signal transduction histidine kinase/ligand-binding sensor domain-containing protein
MAYAPACFVDLCSSLRRAAVRIGVALALVGAAANANAQRSYFRVYDQDYGLDVGEIVALAQDNDGFLWIGSHRGLVRFDGRSFVLWGQDQVDEVVSQIAYRAGADELLVRTATGRGLRRVADGLQGLEGPDGKALHALDSFDFDDNGGLWAAIDGALWRRAQDGAWSPVELRIAQSEKVQRVFATRAGIIVLTDAGAWRLRDGADAQHLVRARDLWFASAAPDSALWIATHFGTGLWRIDDAGAHIVERPDGRALDMHERNGTVWLSLDKLLLAYATDGRVRKLGIADGLPSGGPLLVDRENSLWLGTFVGLTQFPEPDTWQWGEAEGLPSAHTFAVSEYDGTIFASTWKGLASLDGATRRFVHSPAAPVFAALCAIDGRGAFAFDDVHLLRWRDGRFEAIGERPAPALLDSCAAEASGAVWIATTQGLLRLPPGDRPVQTVAVTPPGGIDEIWSDADGVLRVLDDSLICRLRPTGESSAVREDCRSIGPILVPNSIAAAAPGRTWIAANNGIFEFDGKRTRRLAGNHLVAGGILQSLTPASGGDWWAAGAGALLRVHDCGDCESGWEVRETPGQWQGVPGNSAMQARESANGDLWLAGNRGVWRVPKSARAGPEHAPPIVPVRAGIDAVERPLGGAIELAPDSHRLEIEFAALSFRDRTLLRYRSRLAGRGDWSAPSRSPVLQFAALEPGSYRAEMAASLDGQVWSDPPGHIEFRVLPPWYRTWWALLLFATLAIATLAWLYRLRVAALLRVERERTRIAMDLHDELGSGLGSIGMLAGVAAREDLDTGEQRRLMREIANLSGLLGSGLRSLVWSLRSGRAGVAELAAQIADHARRLFPGDSPRLSAQLPADAPDTVLAPELRRHVLLLALEALHNVARHAAARNVALLLQTTGGGGLRLSIADDGRGFDPAADSAGAGLESMRRRAAAIGARLDIASIPGGGTRIVLDWPGTAGRIA